MSGSLYYTMKQKFLQEPIMWIGAVLAVLNGLHGQLVEAAPLLEQIVESVGLLGGALLGRQAVTPTSKISYVTPKGGPVVVGLTPADVRARVRQPDAAHELAPVEKSPYGTFSSSCTGCGWTISSAAEAREIEAGFERHLAKVGGLE